MSILKAIQNKDKALLKKTVAKAVNIYKAEMPEEPVIETCNGLMPLSAVVAIDKKAFWVSVTQAYTEIINTPLPENGDDAVEIAKLIAANPILRTLTNDSKKNNKGLL